MSSSVNEATAPDFAAMAANFSTIALQYTSIANTIRHGDNLKEVNILRILGDVMQQERELRQEVQELRQGMQEMLHEMQQGMQEMLQETREEMRQEVQEMQQGMREMRQEMRFRDENNHIRLQNSAIAAHSSQDALVPLVSIHDGSEIPNFPSNVDAIAGLNNTQCSRILEALDKDASGLTTELRNRLKTAIGVYGVYTPIVRS